MPPKSWFLRDVKKLSLGRKLITWKYVKNVILKGSQTKSLGV